MSDDWGGSYDTIDKLLSEVSTSFNNKNFKGCVLYVQKKKDGKYYTMFYASK